MRDPARGGDPCTYFRGLAAEYAVAAVDGRERHGLVEHLGRCPPCRHASCEYAEVADALLELLPTVEPPPGFGCRTLAHLERVRAEGRTGESGEAAPTDGAAAVAGPGRRDHRDHRDARRIVVAGWVLLVGVCGWTVASGLVAARAPVPPAAPVTPGPVVSAPVDTRAVLHSPVTRDREPIGRIYAHPAPRAGDPTWLYLSLDREGPGAAPGTLTLQLCRRDGAISTAGALTVVDGYGAWAGPVRTDPLDLTGARLLRADGTRYAGAELADP